MKEPGGEKGRREVLFEMFAVGALVKVTAIDAESGTEVSIQGPASAGESALKQTAIRKLIYVLEKKNK